MRLSNRILYQNIFWLLLKSMKCFIFITYCIEKRKACFVPPYIRSQRIWGESSLIMNEQGPWLCWSAWSGVPEGYYLSITIFCFHNCYIVKHRYIEFLKIFIRIPVHSYNKYRQDWFSIFNKVTSLTALLDIGFLLYLMCIKCVSSFRKRYSKTLLNESFKT